MRCLHVKQIKKYSSAYIYIYMAFDAFVLKENNLWSQYTIIRCAFDVFMLTEENRWGLQYTIIKSAVCCTMHLWSSAKRSFCRRLFGCFSLICIPFRSPFYSRGRMILKKKIFHYICFIHHKGVLQCIDLPMGQFIIGSGNCLLLIPGPVFCLLLGVSSDYAQPITGQVTEVTCPVIGRAQPELTPCKRQKTGPGSVIKRIVADLQSIGWYVM